MSKRHRDLDSGRRDFLKGATVVGAAALATPVTANAQLAGAAGAGAAHRRDSDRGADSVTSNRNRRSR